MALTKATLKQQIAAAFENEKNSTDDPSVSIDRVSGAIADAVDAFVKSATITVAAGIPVTTAGTAVAQTGATTAPSIATIN
jgi:hypothetical protein